MLYSCLLHVRHHVRRIWGYLEMVEKITFLIVMPIFISQHWTDYEPTKAMTVLVLKSVSKIKYSCNAYWYSPVRGAFDTKIARCKRWGRHADTPPSRPVNTMFWFTLRYMHGTLGTFRLVSPKLVFLGRWYFGHPPNHLKKFTRCRPNKHRDNAYVLRFL